MRRLRHQEQREQPPSPKDASESGGKPQKTTNQRSGGKEKGEKVEEEFRLVVGLSGDGSGFCARGWSFICQNLRRLLRRCFYFALVTLFLWISIIGLRRSRLFSSDFKLWAILNPFATPKVFQNFTISVLAQGESSQEFEETSRRLSPAGGQRLPKDLQIGLADMSRTYNPKHEVPFFWDIHFSGATVVRNVFTRCFKIVQANENGMRQPNYNDEVSDDYLLHF
jgi:hypothetical protein